MKLHFHTILFCALCGSLLNANACTNITIKAENGDIMNGRTLEFGPNLNTSILTSPRGKVFTNTTPDGKPGKSWHAKYGYVYMNFFGIAHPVDGMNEKGLSFGYLYLPGYTEYQKVSANQDNDAIAYTAFGDWVLGNFDTVDALKSALKKIVVYAEPVTIDSQSNIIFPLHAIITDTSGKSITVEFVKGKMHIYDNNQGTMTNSPTFNWQLTNNKNYINLTPYAPNPIKIDGIEYSGTGQGAGAIGLPGDYSPPSRFVKMTYLVQTAFPVKNAASALNLAQHILNNVDIPYGTVRGIKNTNSPADKTQWTVFKDLQHHILYFKSYQNTTLRSIDLNKIDFSQNATLDIPIESKQIIIDATKNLVKN